MLALEANSLEPVGHGTALRRCVLRRYIAALIVINKKKKQPNVSGAYDSGIDDQNASSSVLKIMQSGAYC